MRLAALAVLSVLGTWAAGPADVADIMARVAAHQQARDAPNFCVYRQEQVLRMRRGNGKLAREQRLDYVVTPGTDALGKQLASVWFPLSYDGEFKVRAVFFYKRKLSVSLLNGDFRKADVNSTVVYGTDAH